MRSEKEILKQEAEDAYIDEFTYDGDVESIYEAMKINAKETSIEFLKWHRQYRIDIDPHNQGTVQKIEFEKMSIEERYNLFIKSLEEK